MRVLVPIVATLFVATLTAGFFLLPSHPAPASPALTSAERQLVRALVAVASEQREPAAQDVDAPVPILVPGAEPAGPSQELVELQARVRDLEAALASPESLRYYLRLAEDRAALEPDGQIGQWAALLADSVIPDEHTRLVMASLLHDYPVVLEAEEGLWLAERIRLEDWHLFGPTVDEAIALFLGAERIAQARADKEAEER